MKNPFSTILKTFLLLSLAALPGCNVPAAPAPTMDPQIIASAVSAAQTAAVQAVYVQLTQSAALNPSATLPPPPTSTTRPTETATMTPVPPLPTLTPTKKIVYTPGPTFTPTQGAYQCTITTLKPEFGEVLANGVDFDLSVTLKNTGEKPWSSNSIDFRYLSGAKFQKSVDVIDLPSDVAPGDSVDLVIDMIAKTGTGIQNAAWGLVLSSTTFCPVEIHVNVK
jgi:hypothetical protein